MKHFSKYRVQSRWLALALGLLTMQAGQSWAQTFTNIYNFQSAATNQFDVWTNQNGVSPSGTLLLLGGTLFGAAGLGGTNGAGCIYSVNTNGLGFVNLHDFAVMATNKFGIDTNRDGTRPVGGLVAVGTNLFGVTYGGGTNGQGTIFSLSTNGSGFTTLHEFTAVATNSELDRFTNSDGAVPACGLILSDSTLYGTTTAGSTNGNGSVFAMQTNGTGFVTLHGFTALVASNNTDGAAPYATLLQAGGTLYGTTQFGGTNGTGTVFSLSTNGAGFADLHSFAPTVLWASGPYANIYTNGDGANTRAQLILVNNTLFGAGTVGGLYGYGAVFELPTNGPGFKTVYSFAAGQLDFSNFGITNHDGEWPQPGLVYSSGALYGVNEYGGLGLGTVFSLDTNGGEFTVVHDFPVGSTLTILPLIEDLPNNGGAYPQTEFLLSGGTLYSSSAYGGSGGSGTLFAITGLLGSMPAIPTLTPTKFGTNLLMTWPSNYTGYTLQYSTNLITWLAASPSAVITGTNYAVTNSITRTNRFFRLMQ